MITLPYDGFFKLDKNNNGWWISYNSYVMYNYSNQCKTIRYFYKENLHNSMGVTNNFLENYFVSKEIALEEFFKCFPDKEIIDDSESPAITLKKKQETWRDRPPLL